MVSFQRADLRDPTAHGAGTDNADFADIHDVCSVISSCSRDKVGKANLNSRASQSSKIPVVRERFTLAQHRKGGFMTAEEMIRCLVGFDTVSRDSNLPLIEFVENYLDDLGVCSHRVASDDGLKSNLYATVGPDEDGGVVLSGHTDVVPVDGQDWDTDPFALNGYDGRLHGRGTCDMKGFIAIALALVPEMKKLRRPVHFALSYDEEIGCRGAPEMIEKLAAVLPSTQAVIVGEPTSMTAVTGHKGIVALKTTVRG